MRLTVLSGLDPGIDLADPYVVATSVKSMLDKDRFADALTMAQAASAKEHHTAGKSPVVSWNYIIGYCFKHAKVEKAFKLYNDVRSNTLGTTERY